MKTWWLATAGILISLLAVSAAHALIIVPQATLQADHAGASIRDSFGGPRPTVVGSELTDVNNRWTITHLQPWQNPTPPERGVYMLFRGTLGDGFESTPSAEVNYSLVKGAIGATETEIEFLMPPLGDPNTPSGIYTLLLAELPEFKSVYDDQLGDYVDVPYTTQDFLDWITALPNSDGTPPTRTRSITFDYVAGAAPTATLTPVVIIPGILGSAEHNGEWLIDPITHAYDNLIDTLLANGYERNLTLFPFPYDWHKSNIDTAVLLKEKVDAVKEICGCDKVDIVAHSMGGLVARQYIQSNYYGNDVRKLIFLGTPHLGAPKAYLMWEGGENDIGKADQRIKMFLKIEALKHGYISLFDYIHDTPIPSVRELLPVYGYIKHTGSPDVPAYPNTDWYPSNQFLENLNGNISSLYSSGVSLTNFVGDTAGDVTIITIRVVPPTSPRLTVLWGFGFPENFGNSSTDQGLERGDGDATVPLSSADLITDDLHLINSEHGELPTKAESDVFTTLTGKSPSSLVTGKERVDVPILIFQILSPADIQVIAPDGKKVGKNFETGQEINEILDAFYSGFGTDTEFITIPNPLDGEYKIFTQGTGEGGEYTIAAGLISDAGSNTEFFTGQTLPSLITEHDVEIDAEHPEETTILPTDQEPPTVTFNQPTASTFTHSQTLPVDITFADDTGIAASSVSFDKSFVGASTTIDLFFKALGDHPLTASAEDLVGNATTTTRIIHVVATPESTLSDINRASSLRWLKKGIKDALAAQLTITAKLKRRGDKMNVYKAMLRTLSVGKLGGMVNKQAYDLLAADINWLISH